MSGSLAPSPPKLDKLLVMLEPIFGFASAPAVHLRHASHTSALRHVPGWPLRFPPKRSVQLQAQVVVLFPRRLSPTCHSHCHLHLHFDLLGLLAAPHTAHAPPSTAPTPSPRPAPPSLYPNCFGTCGLSGSRWASMRPPSASDRPPPFTLIAISLRYRPSYLQASCASLHPSLSVHLLFPSCTHSRDRSYAWPVVKSCEPAVL
jgi:hypothetical protein